MSQLKNLDEKGATNNSIAFAREHRQCGFHPANPTGRLISLFCKKIKMLFKIIIDYAPLLIMFLMPFALLVWPSSPTPNQSMLPRLLLICLLGWILFAFVAWCTRNAWQTEFAQTGQVPEKDPTFLIAVYVVGGGFLTFLGALPSLLIRGVADLIHARRNKNKVEQVGNSDTE